jgi:hypothetical protein
LKGFALLSKSVGEGFDDGVANDFVWPEGREWR